MGRALSRSEARLRAILDELEVLRPDSPSGVAAALHELRELAELEAIVCVVPVPSTSGWVLDRFIAENLPNATRFRTLLASHLARSADAFGWFDPYRPELEQRNRLVDLRELVPAEQYEASRAYTEVLEPLRLHRHHVVRALLCENDALVAYLAVFQPAPLTDDQRAILASALPALQRRLSIERQIEAAPLVSAALAAVLEHIAAPAFVVSSTGRIIEVNAAGRTLLATRRAEISEASLASLAHEPTAINIEITPLDCRGAPDHSLAVIRTRTADGRAAQAVALVAARLKLTRRQRDVLARVVTGETNASIAKALGITERAVEQHVTALFDRTAVDSRAALVTYVLLG